MNVRSLIFLAILIQNIGLSQTAELQPKSEKELYLIGAVHTPTPNINADTIFALLEKINPSLILIEADHHVFDQEYNFKKTYSGNEWDAILRYQKKYPDTRFRPFEIEGRNQLRKKRGIYSGAGFVFNEIYDLDSLNQLTKDQSKIWNRFEELADSLATFNTQSLQVLNAETTDNLVEERQFYQYKKTKEITDTHPRFSQGKLVGSNKDTLTLKAYFKQYSNFEQLRNNEMAENIMKWIQETEDRKIVVLVGYYHRFALIERLKYKQQRLNFELKSI